MRMVVFLAVVACIAAVAAMLVCLPLWLDRVIVFVMRVGHIYIFPVAIRLALSLETQEDEWQLDNNRLRHPTIGTVWLVSNRTLNVELPSTNQSKNVTWTPGWIEQRIIRDAANGLIHRRRVNQLNSALPPLSL